MLEITLFGEPCFHLQGRVHSFQAPPKTLPLLAYLLLHRSAATQRDVLARIFWPDADEETARANLRRHLHYIRKALPEGQWICADGKSVQWNDTSPYRLDVAEFEQRSRIPQLVPLAIKLYAGDLYASCEEEWLYFERERLRSMQAGNLAALAEEAERSLDHVGAAQLARQLLKLEPWREDAVRILMRSRMQTGDRGGALEEYERFAQRLHDELGVEPLPETQALYEGFIAQDQRTIPAAPQAHGLIGRESELDDLLVQWRTASGGRAAVAVVGGEAGVGKSTLLRELSHEVREIGGMVITGEIAAAGEAPFAAVTRALSSMQSHPVLRRTSAAPIAPALSDTSDRGAFFASVAQALRALSEKSPLLFVIEDLHWAGGDTIALIEFLERRLRDARIMIAASYRDEAVGPGHPLRGLRRVLSERPTYRHIALNALVRADVERLARERLGDQATPERIEALYWRTGGNALFLTESLETLASGDGAAIPSTISELVRGRYDELTARSQDAVERLAVAGAMIPMNVLNELFYETERNVLPAVLQELAQSRFVQQVDGAMGDSLAFHHEIVRESLYERIPWPRRTEMHLRTAKAMERVGAARYVSAIAEHYERADKPHEAAVAYTRSATQALHSFANDDAERYARKALALDGDAAVAMQAYECLCRVYHRSGQRQAQLQCMAEMEEVAQRSRDPLYIGEAIYNRLARAAFENDINETKKQLDRLRDAAVDGPIWKARIEAFSGAYEVMRADFTAAWNHFQAALELCRSAGYIDGELLCYVRLLEICDGHTRPFDRLLREARELQERLGDPDSAFLLANAEADLFLHIDRSQCQQCALRMIDAGEQTGDHIYTGVGHMYLAAVATYRFEPEAAEHHFALAEKALEDTSRRVDLARFYRFRGLYHLTTADVRSGLDDSLRSLEIAREAHAYDLLALSAGNALYAYGLLNEFDRAHALADRMSVELEHLGEQHVAVHHMRLSLGLLLAAQERASEAVPLMKASFEQHAIRGAKLHAAWSGTLLAYELSRCGRVDEARPYVENYLNVLPDMIDEGWMPELTLWQTAQVLRTLREREQAQKLLQRSAQVMSNRLRALPREEQQRRFMELPVHRQILRALTENVWPTI